MVSRWPAPGRTLHMILTICAAGYGVQTYSGSGLPVVCGRQPGHGGRHRDVEYTLEWSDQ
jgi:hypothetical protein